MADVILAFEDAGTFGRADGDELLFERFRTPPFASSNLLDHHHHHSITALAAEHPYEFASDVPLARALAESLEAAAVEMDDEENAALAAASAATSAAAAAAAAAAASTSGGSASPAGDDGQPVGTSTT